MGAGLWADRSVQLVYKFFSHNARAGACFYIAAQQPPTAIAVLEIAYAFSRAVFSAG
jgi:hypothetical protein